jgi:hypothetical protein
MIKRLHPYEFHEYLKFADKAYSSTDSLLLNPITHAVLVVENEGVIKQAVDIDIVEKSMVFIFEYSLDKELQQAANGWLLSRKLNLFSVSYQDLTVLLDRPRKKSYPVFTINKIIS